LLSDRYSGGVINSLSSTGLEATAVFGLPHNLKKYQVVRVSGATQAEYNGDFKIKQVVNATTIKFELNSVASVANASGTINCMLAPLNWDKPFSSSTALGGGRAAYRSKDETLPNRPFYVWLMSVSQVTALTTPNMQK
jgi:hypothetical protein